MKRFLGGERSTPRGLAKGSLSVLLFLCLLAACTLDAARKQAESEVLRAFDFPAGYEFLEEWETGDGSGGPMIAYHYVGERVPAPEDVNPPPGFDAVQASSRREYDEYLPMLDEIVTWKPAVTYEGPTLDGNGECLVWVAQSVTPDNTLLSLGGVCDPEGPLPG